MCELDFNVFMKKLDAAQAEIDRKRERLNSKAIILEWSRKYIEHLKEAQSEIDSLKKDKDDLQRQLAEERKQRAEMEMKLAEMTKLLGSIAKKSSEEGMQKALQTFVNYSKRKTPDKRTYIKNTILEFTNVNRITLSEELANAIDALDDEQTEPKNITVNGNYNDIHDNKEVKMRDVRCKM